MILGSGKDQGLDRRNQCRLLVENEKLTGVFPVKVQHLVDPPLAEMT